MELSLTDILMIRPQYQKIVRRTVAHLPILSDSGRFGVKSITLGFLVRVQITISGPREGTRLCSSPNSGIDERFEDLDLDFELI